LSANRELKSVNSDGFQVKIFDSGDKLIQSFNHASEVPESLTLKAGSYYITASSNNNLPAAFSNPFYFGQTEVFTIVAGKTKEVSVVCKLSNIRVTVAYSDAVKADFLAANTTVSNATGNLIYAKDETRAGYFDAGPLTIVSELTYLKGSVPETITLNGSINSPVVGKHYEIRVDAKLSEGFGNFGIQVDESFESEIVLIKEAPNPDPDPDPGMSLLITEVMYNPAALSDTEGEYIELYNAGSAAVNLNGMVIRRGSNNDKHVISTDVVVQPGTYVLLGRSANACSQVDYVYSVITLVNSGGDEIIINRFGTDGTDGEVVCRLNFGAPGFTTTLNGKSIQLSRNKYTKNEAGLASSWCTSTLVYNTGDYGSPGTENNICN
jgi:hypothetical protein